MRPVLPLGRFGFFLLLAFASSLPGATAPAQASASPATSVPRLRILAAGDSITEGSAVFSSYRLPLARKLHAAGYAVEFVGTRVTDTDLGPLRHEGYGGKNTEALLALIPSHFREQPADVVLFHSGHNHTVEEKPVAGIVAATEKLIAAFREVNPGVTVLLAQVIPAGKLPKYDYLPELNGALAQLARRLDAPTQRVILVDQAAGFDWRTDTVEDHVHPNPAGAEKMAEVWFQALQPILRAARDAKPAQ